MTQTQQPSRNIKELWHLIKAWDLDALTDRELYKIIVWVVALLALALALFFTFINPGPPKTMVISTGSKTGAYNAFAKQYQTHFAKQGIKLEVVESAGSLENLQRLRNQTMVPVAQGGSYPVMAAFVQSGTSTEEDGAAENLESLASVAYEPIWVFHRLGQDLVRLSDLAGKRIAIGAPGTGSYFAAQKLLAKTGIEAKTATLLTLGGEDAVTAVAQGQADAVVLVASPKASSVAQAFDAKLKLISFAQADAYLRNFPWLQKVVMPRGVVSLAKDLPADDVTLVAATANLVAHKDLHRSLAFLLMDTASLVHAPADITQSLREFPSAKALEFAQSDESKRYLASGRPFLQSYLPFWLANWVERVMASFVPVLLIALPLLKGIASFIHRRESAHLARHYVDLEALEASYHEQRITAEQARHTLDAMRQHLRKMDMPSTALSQVFSAKTHLEETRSRMQLV